MKISNNENLLTFSSRCPEIRLGQDICHVVNTKYPHFSTTKYQPLISKWMKNIKNPSSLMTLLNGLSMERPILTDNMTQYFNDLFEYSEKYHSFNCHESSLLSARELMLRGFNNVYTARLQKGHNKIDHIVCFFNRDGSMFDGQIKNNQTIILDTWAGICDFANNIFNEYNGFWSKYIKEEKFHPQTDKFEFKNVQKFELSEKI